MKRPLLFSSLLTFLFCFSLFHLQAQCNKSRRASNKSKTDNVNYQKTACQKYRSSCSDRKAESNDYRYDDDFYHDDYLMVLGGATTDGADNYKVTTGLEYEKRLGSVIGVGALAEVNFAENPSILTGIPVSFHLTRNVRLSAAPTLLTQNIPADDNKLGTTATESTWENSFGARLGLSYLINVNGFVVAPTVRGDYLNEQVRPGFGLNLGLTF
ncbi:MAG: hypothetical protein AAF985_01000 [Bacteroidota bacterium]